MLDSGLRTERDGRNEANRSLVDDRDELVAVLRFSDHADPLFCA